MDALRSFGDDSSCAFLSTNATTKVESSSSWKHVWCLEMLPYMSALPNVGICQIGIDSHFLKASSIYSLDAPIYHPFSQHQPNWDSFDNNHASTQALICCIQHTHWKLIQTILTAIMNEDDIESQLSPFPLLNLERKDFDDVRVSCKEAQLVVRCSK